MAGVSVAQGGGGRRSVDQSVNMVPMIDLLISVIAFLLMTAVWVQTGVLQARQPQSNGAVESLPEDPALTITVSAEGFRVGNTAADAEQLGAGDGRFVALRAALATRHQVAPAQRRVQVQADSGVTYDELMRVMDTVYDVWGEGRPPGRSVRELVQVQLL